MKNLYKTITAIFILAISATLSHLNAADVKSVKYVFLFIGDGMSIPQRMMTEEFLKKSGDEGLFINQMPNQAITYTRSANSFITDSAASGTAIACGTKTNNGRIGVDSDGKKLESIAYVAKTSGKKVGIVTSVTMNHATPAAFYAHNVSRGNYYQISLDAISSNFDYFGGGGMMKHDDSKNKSYKSDFYTLAESAGYKVLRGSEQIKAFKNDANKLMAYGSDEALPYAIDNSDNLKLADFVKLGIDFMKDSPQGFFMMAEGGKIDWMCHANDAATVMREVVDFDNAVKVACEFAKSHPSQTLIVVTGDHETGGLTLGFAGTGYESFIQLLKNQKCSQDAFDKKIKQSIADNPKMSFEDAMELAQDNFGLKLNADKKDPMKLSSEEIDSLKSAFEKQKSKNKSHFTRALIKCLDNKCALAWTSGAHTALPVNTTAIGAQSENFKGAIDNTDIAKILKQAVK